MVVVYVRLWPSRNPHARPSKRVYALLLKSEGKSAWDELEVRSSLRAGFGVYPKNGNEDAINWARLTCPVLVPYFGVETVWRDAGTINKLRAVLRGDFQPVVVGELIELHGGPWVTENELYAVYAMISNPRLRIGTAHDCTLIQ